MTTGAVKTTARTCRRCGMQWEQPVGRGAVSPDCPTCRPYRRHQTSPETRPAPALQLALAVTNYRLAIELASSALRLGRPREALTYLEAVEAPARRRYDPPSAP